MKTFYTICCVLGIVLPYSAFVPWLLDNGIAPMEFVKEAIDLRIGLFAWLDVLVSALVLVMFIQWEGERLSIRRLWLPWVGTGFVGVSLGLPLFLLLRQIELEAGNEQTAALE